MDEINIKNRLVPLYKVWEQIDKMNKNGVRKNNESYLSAVNELLEWYLSVLKKDTYIERPND